MSGSKQTRPSIGFRSPGNFISESPYPQVLLVGDKYQRNNAEIKLLSSRAERFILSAVRWQI